VDSNLNGRRALLLVKTGNFFRKNGQSARMSAIVNFLSRLGFDVEIIQLKRIIRKSVIKEISSKNPQLVVGSSFVIAPMLTRIAKSVETFYWIDFMDSVFETRKFNNAGIFRWIYFNLFENPALKKLTSTANIITYISQKDFELDENLLKAIEPNSKVFIFPNIYDHIPRTYIWSRIKRLVIVGDFSYIHNKQMLRIASQISNILNLPLHIYGDSGNSIRNFSSKSFVHGYVESEQEIYQLGDLHVAPVDQIAGIKNKVTNALQYGIPVLTTCEGAQGINKSSGLYIFSLSGLDQISLNNIENSLVKTNNLKIWNGFAVDESKNLSLFINNHFLPKGITYDQN
jgi:hypothetical protein